MTAGELAQRLIPEPIIRHIRIPQALRLATVSIKDGLIVTAPVFSQLVLIVSQSMQPGYNPIRDTISSLVWGPGGWLQTVNFCIFGVLLVSLALKLYPGGAGKVGHRAGGSLLFLIGLGFFILAICPTRSPGSPQTVPTVIHGIAVYFIVFLFPVVCFLLAPVFKSEPGSRFLFFYSTATGALSLAVIIGGVFLVIGEAHWFGMLERVLLLNGFIWIEVVGIQFLGLDFTRAKSLSEKTVTLFAGHRINRCKDIEEVENEG